MEEILASIRRIISEDGDDEAKAPAPAPAPAPKPSAAAKPAPRPAPAPAPEPEVDEDDDVLELTDIVPEEEPLIDDDLVMVERNERPSPRSSVPRPRYAEETQLISDTVREQAQSSFMQLARNVLVAESTSDPRSLEALVQEMLRPILQQWLNENLPSMVEGLVQQEIERVTRRERY